LRLVENDKRVYMPLVRNEILPELPEYSRQPSFLRECERRLQKCKLPKI